MTLHVSPRRALAPRSTDGDHRPSVDSPFGFLHSPPRAVLWHHDPEHRSRGLQVLENPTKCTSNPRPYPSNPPPHPRPRPPLSPSPPPRRNTTPDLPLA